MVEYIWIGLFFVTFLVTLYLTRLWINMATREGKVARDANKLGNKLIPYSGGVGVLTGFIFGVLLYIGISTFYFDRTIRLVEILALLVSVMITGFIGFLDDNIGGWKKGLKQWQKPLLTLPSALPLMAIKAGDSAMSIPLLGRIEFGILYPLLAVPIGLTGASQGFNILAGLNGLEGGMALIIIGTLSFVSWKLGNTWLAIVGFCMVSALIAYLWYNKYPAKVFPGDVLLYALGAFIAGMAILGNMERIALILFIPYFVELIIKIKNKFKSECFLIPQEDGSVKAPERTGSFTHIMARFIGKFKKKVYEYDIVFGFIVLELILSLTALSV